MDSFRNKNVLITGGLGFIGSNLAIKLVELGANVTIVDSLIPEYGGNLFNIEPVKNLVKVNISDVRDTYSLKFLVKNQDILFNLAGQTSHLDSMQDPFTDLEINSKAQLSILETCRNNNPDIKIIFASTRQIYGKPKYLPVDEYHPINPVDVNGINKLSGELLHILYHQVYGIRTIVLRLTNTIGPRMRIRDARQTFLGIWIKNVIESKPIIIYGDGSQIRDFNYVDDVIAAFLLCASSENVNGEVFNLGDKNFYSLKKVAEMLIELNGTGNYELIPFPKERKMIDIGNYYSDYSKIRNSLGWEPKTNLWESLDRTLQYFKKFYEQYV